MTSPNPHPTDLVDVTPIGDRLDAYHGSARVTVRRRLLVRTDPNIGDAVVESILDDIDLPSPQHRRALRLASGFTAQELADLVGVTLDTLHEWEAGMPPAPTGRSRARYGTVLAALSHRDRRAERMTRSLAAQPDGGPSRRDPRS